MLTKAIKYKNKNYKNLSQLYNELKTPESPKTYFGFKKRLTKVKSISLALKISAKKLKYDHYKKIYLEKKDNNSVSLKLFVSRMRKGMKVENAISRKLYESALMKKIVIDGEYFSNLTQLALKFNIKPAIIIKRYKKGIRGKRLLFGAKNVLKYKGYFYKNKKEFASKLNIPIHILSKELKKGKKLDTIILNYKNKLLNKKSDFILKKKITVKKSLDLKKPATYNKNINLPVNFYYKNFKYKTIKDLAKKFNIDYTTIFRRIKKGLSIEDAIKGGSPRGGYKLKINVGNLRYNSLTDFALKNNISRKIIKENLKKGMSLDEILENKDNLRGKVGKEKKLLKYRNSNLTYDQASKKFNLHKSTISNFLKTGLTLDQLEEKLILEKKKKKIIYKDLEYESIEEFIHKNSINISVNLFKARMRKGYSIKEIIEQGDRIVSEGAYNLKILSRNTALANSKAYIYFLKIRFDDRYLYKIGITRNTIEERVSSFEEIPRKNISIVKFKTAKLIDCYNLEQEILKIYKNNRFLEPSLKYTGGRTEILKLNESEVAQIISLLN